MHSVKLKTLLASIALAAAGAASAQTQLLNVSYDVAREFYKDYNAAFIAHYKKTKGVDIKVDQSHGGSSAQARAVNDGLAADVVTFNTTTDVDFLAQNGVVAKDWNKKFPHDASPTTSTMLFLVRNGNPKNIEDWSDRVDGGIGALTETGQKETAGKDRLTQEAVELTEREGKYKQLTRDAKNAEEMHALLLRRLNESSLEEQDFANNIRVLDEARQPGGPISPNVRRSGMMGLALGFMLAFGLAFLIEFLDRTVKSQEDIETVAGLPFLGMVPSVGDPGDAPTPELFISKNPTSTVAECCRVVRTNIQFCSADKPMHTMLVTSSNPVEGKTLNVVQLGIVMAQNGLRTLLVDTDMRRPRLHKAMKLSNENGVSRVLVGESDLDSAIKTTDVPNLYALPCGPIPPNPAELLQTERFAALVAQLAGKFDRVIFDSPPILAVTDRVVLSRLVDGTVLVVRAGPTSPDALKRSKQALRNVGTQITGVILNDVNLKNPAYAGYYNYYHYQYHEAPAASAGSKS